MWPTPARNELDYRNALKIRRTKWKSPKRNAAPPNEGRGRAGNLFEACTCSGRAVGFLRRRQRREDVLVRVAVRPVDGARVCRSRRRDRCTTPRSQVYATPVESTPSAFKPQSPQGTRTLLPAPRAGLLGGKTTRRP